MSSVVNFLMQPLISVTDLHKQFTEVKAVDNLSFSVYPGDIYGFLGQNGAGKSTTIRMLLTLITPTAGSIEMFGYKLPHHRSEILRHVGAIIERTDLCKFPISRRSCILAQVSDLCSPVTCFSASACEQKNSPWQMPGFFGG